MIVSLNNIVQKELSSTLSPILKYFSVTDT